MALLRVRERPGPVRVVALLLHGGAAQSDRPGGDRGFAALRMRTFERDLARLGGVATALISYRERGWNGGDRVDDVRAAVATARARWPGVPIVLVGHSMGGRAALRAAGEGGVVAVVSLAGWLPADEPIEQVAGRTLVLAHGDRDRVTAPDGSRLYAKRARPVAAHVEHVTVAGAGHRLIRRSRRWHELVREVVVSSAQDRSGVVPDLDAGARREHGEDDRHGDPRDPTDARAKGLRQTLEGDQGAADEDNPGQHR